MSTSEPNTDAALSLNPYGLAEIPATAATLTAPRNLSLRSNFAWALTGNVVFAACQWGMIVALAKLGSSFMVGQFSLALAIATPILMFSNFDLRAVQATDAQRQYRFNEYLRLRLFMTLVALTAIGAIVWLGGYERRTALVILAVAVAKAVETLSDIHYGLFQLNGRLDQTGRSMMLRGLVSLATLSAVLYATHNIFWACAGVAVAWAVALLLFDIRRGRRMVAVTESAGVARRSGLSRQKRLLWLALPMGVVTTTASVNLHMPRYFIHARMGEHQLGVFSALAYATVSLTLVGDSLGSSAIPWLSRMYACENLAEYRALLLRLLTVGTGIGLCGVAIAHTFGGRLISLFYSPEYAIHAHVFTLLVGAAAIHFAASMLTSGITSARCFRLQVPLYAVVAGVTALGCALWVPAYGLAGGAMAVICGATARLLLAAAVLWYLLFSPSHAARAGGWSL